MAIERLKVPGKRLVETVKQLASRGDARRICLLSEEKHLLDIPVAVGDPAAPATALEAPVMAAINAFATMISECTVEVEKTEES
ncbi:MAG: DUF4342 domain-containing protein [Chloroflexi bacterium]|nr:DUF4342 domain-containing protein [Chloroflexota bacterium]